MSGRLPSARNPLISVILPTHNRAAVLPEAVASVLAQTWEHFELLVVDDASTDDIPAALARQHDGRIRLHRRDTQGGPAAARNTGLLAARGEFVAFQDSDDVWEPTFLSELHAALEAAGAGSVLAFCRYWHTDPSGTRLLPHPMPLDGSDIGLLLAQRSFISTQTVLVRKALVDRAGGFDERLPALVDWDLFLRLSEVGTFVPVVEPLVRVRESPDSVSRQGRTVAEAYERIIGKYEARFHAARRQFARHCLATGGIWCRCGEMTRGRTWLRTAWRTAPWSAEAALTYVASWLGPQTYRRLAQIRWNVARRARRDAGPHPPVIGDRRRSAPSE